MPTARSRVFWNSTVLLPLLVLAGLVGATPARAETAEDIAWQLRQDLEIPLKAKADALWKEKNEAGLNFQRGSYSKRFHKIDDGTYEVMFIKDIASPERMRSERYRTTLKGSGIKWDIAEEKLEGTYERLIRSKPGDETFHRFESFSFDREGMAMQAGAGSLVIDYLLGQPKYLLLTGANVSFDFTPPADLEFHQSQIWAYLKHDRPEQFAFAVEGIVLECDPATCKELLERSFKGLSDSTHDALDPKLKDYFDKELNKERDARRDHPFDDFLLPLEPEHRYYQAAAKKSGKDQWVTLSYDNESAWEVSIWVSDYGRVIGYPSEATRRSGIDPYELEMREDRDARFIDLTALSVNVELGLEDPELLRADATYHIRLKRETQELEFGLEDLKESSEKEGSFTINALQDEKGEDLLCVRRGTSEGLVILPEKLPAGSEIVLRMAYETRGSIRKQSPSYSNMARGGWLPFVNYTDKIDDFQMTTATQSRYKTLGIGGKVSESTKGGVTTTTWKAQAVHFPTIIFGDYFEDVPGTIAKKSDGTEIPVAIHVDKDSMRDWGIPPKNLRPLAAQAVNAVNIYRELFGADYPHAKLDLVNDPGEGISAQAPDSIVYVGSAVFRGEAVLAEALGGAAGRITERIDSLIAHEVAHQWWGGRVGNANFRHYWFVESLAEYSSALYMEIIEGEGWKNPEKARKAYLRQVDRWRKETLETDIMNSVENCRMGWLGEESFQAYVTLVYAKGPYAFHILRSTFGDEKFFAFLKNLMKELNGKNVVTRDIQRVAEESFGGTMEWFFDQWIRGVGIPEFSFNHTSRQTEDGGYVVEITVRQHVVAGLKKIPLDGVYYRGIVPIVVVGKNRQEYRTGLLVEGPETKKVLKVPSEPANIVFNRDGEMLALPVLDNRSW